MFSWRNNYQLGLDWGTNSLKLVELNMSKEVPHLENWGIEEWPAAEPEGKIDFLTQLKNRYQLNTKEVIIGIGGSDLILKKITCPEIGPQELTQVVNWEVADKLPVSADEMVVDYEVLAGEEDTKDVLVAAARREAVMQRVNLLQAAGFQVKSAAASPLVFPYLLPEANEQLSKLAVLDLGAETTELVVITDGEFTLRRSFQLGGAEFTTELKKRRNITYRQAEEEKLESGVGEQLLDEVLGKLIAEINRSFQYHNLEQVNQLLLTGGTAKLQPLTEWLTAKLELSTGLFNSLASFQFAPDRFDPQHLRRSLPELSVSLGLALRGRVE